MKKKYILITGIIVGLLAGNGIQIFASDAIRHITAAVNETFQIKVDGEKTDLPDEYELLIYNITYLKEYAFFRFSITF